MSNTFDVAVIGGGIVGLATARAILARDPGCSLVLLEKEPTLAAHQTGHNSGVLHSGIYYKPGSLKAVNCREGKLAMQAFCDEEQIPYELCGKVIVATEESELPSLEKIYERGIANGIACEYYDRDQLFEREPHAAGVRAIHVPESGIVNYRRVCERMAERIGEQDAASGRRREIRTGCRVTDINAGSREVTIKTTTGTVTAGHLVNCAGLFSDRVARMTGMKVGAQIVPFRGEYFELKPEVQHLCKHLIYPVPDPKFPFLGVHFTRMIEGGVECGPNAVLAFAREGYTKTKINPRDLAESLSYPGFLKMAARHWRMGAGEMWRSVSKGAFVRALRKLMPVIEKKHLVAAPAGVRAQALLPDGSLVDDFLIREAERVVNVCNAPSPAATASLKIGESIADRVRAVADVAG